MFSSQHPDLDQSHRYSSPVEPRSEFSREAADARARAAADELRKSMGHESGSTDAASTTATNAQRPLKTLSKPYTELVVDALRDQVQSGEIPHPPSQAPRTHLKYVKRVVDRRRVVRFNYVRGPKPHIRLPDNEGTPDFMEAYEAARRATNHRWRSRQQSTKPHRSMSDLVELYRRSEACARLAPDTQRVYGRVLHRLLHVEDLATCSAASLGRQRIQQLIGRHAAAPAAAADLLKKLRILFRCARAHGWRSDDPTRGVRIGRIGVVAAHQQS